MKSLFISLFVFAFTISSIHSQSSIFKTGQWIKIGVLESGVYKVDKSFFEQNNLNTESINPNKIRIFGSGYNGSVPQLNSESSLFQPVEIESSFYGDNDDVLEEGEFIYFYLQSSDKIFFDSINSIVSSNKNIYTDSSFYLLSYELGERKTISKEVNIIEYDSSSNYGFNYFHYEKDIYNIIQSGREWYGKIFSSGDLLSVNLFDIKNESDIDIEISLISRSTYNSNFTVSFNDQLLSDIEMDIIKDKLYGEKSINKKARINSKVVNKENNSINVKYQGTGSAISYLDYLKINSIIPLNYENQQIIFYSKPQDHNYNVRYNISSNQNIRTWNITNPYKVIPLKIKKEDESKYYFISDNTQFRNNIIFDISKLKSPVYHASIKNTDILNHNNPELLIITSDEFLGYANTIKELRENNDYMSVKIVNVSEIFNQFSAGNQDVSSIRNYIKYIYNTSQNNLKYVLLFGDCSYDYKDRIPNNTNIVPIYQSYNSSNNIYSFSSDDYFGFLDSDEGSWLESISGDHDLEVSIGRIPAKNTMDADAYVKKLIRYSDKKNLLGDWKKNIYLVADDGDGNIHQNDAENHFDFLNDSFGEYNIKKIYLDNYDQPVIDGVHMSPNAKKDLDEAIIDGSLILNYVGHGNEFLWTEEKILNNNSIYSWNNRLRLPLFVTATCEFGKYDDPLITSGGEMLLNKENGGAIALLTTTRPVFSKTNFKLNNQFYKNVFKKVNGKHLRLGDIFKSTKNNSLSGSINRNFSLLGDPSLMLNYPNFKININGIDTISAGDEVTIKGNIIDDFGNKVNSFSGNLYVNIFDKINSKTTLGDESSPFKFREWDNIIFKGLSSVNNGDFEFQFKVSKNIDYSYNEGKLSLFGIDSIQGFEASSYSNFIIGGTSESYEIDMTPPDVEIFINNYDFNSGDVVTKNPLLIVDVFDDNGINVSNKNEFLLPKAIIDDSINVSLLRYFSQVKDSYTKGKILYPLNNISKGKHKIKINISDNYNNITTKEVVFIIGEKNKPIISELMNYPNPFSETTTFKFHNKDYGQPLKIDLQIFDLRGNLLHSISENYEISPYIIENLIWDGTDLNGYSLPQGIYIYKLHVQNLIDYNIDLEHHKLIKRKR